MTEQTTLEKADLVKIVEEECSKDVVLMEKFIESGLSHEEFFNKHMASEALKSEQDKKNQEASDAELEKHNAEKKAAEEKLAKEQAEEAEQKRKALEDQANAEAAMKKSAGKLYKVLKRFYVRTPASNGDIEKRIAQIGEEIKAEYISKEVIDLKLVEKV